ncbi:hypothetical protein NC651_026333 [Populus alba x Populus x berolinensis]|nr:hypothetical protein NC651_026333 [Populus alba x Populus x berolinensis]
MSIFQQRKTRSKFISYNLHGLYSPRYVSNATISAEGAYCLFSEGFEMKIIFKCAEKIVKKFLNQDHLIHPLIEDHNSYTRKKRLLLRIQSRIISLAPGS